MRPFNRKFRAGLAAIGLLGTTAADVVAQVAAPSMPASSAVPAPPNAPRFAVLLLSNGRMLRGNVTEAASGDAYELHMKGGSVPVPKKDVVRRYDSLEAMYRDKASHLPPGDPDERMKLALWCLEQHMEAEAREQLQGVLSINPTDRRAERMVASIDANAHRMAMRDPAVLAAGAEVVEPARRPMAMPLPRPKTSVGRGAGRPVIFDLPPEAAMKRFAEFAWDVHPILQASCAGCHNESHPGEFRLVTARSRREWSMEVLRANLDATLRFVRAEDPTHGELMAFATSAHGPNPRPVFHGPNDRRQQLLTAWLKLLESSGSAAPSSGSSSTSAAQARSMPAAPAGEGFGADRLPPPRPNAPKAITAPGAQHFTQTYQMDATAPGVPAGARFDLPTMPGAPGAMPAAIPGVVTAQAPAMPPLPPDAAAKLPDLPPGTPVPPPDDVIPPTKRSKKTAKVNPALLEQLLKNRQPAQP